LYSNSFPRSCKAPSSDWLPPEVAAPDRGSRLPGLRSCEETRLVRYTSHTITEIDRLLEDLAGVRQGGYASDGEEEVYGVFCVGAPFFDHSGTCAGTVSVTGIKQDLPDWRLAEPGRLIRRLADQASALLGGPSFNAVPPTMGIQPATNVVRVPEPAR
jgi:Bacterial transcriptional regulator